jgi:16S rRNA (cytosine967-C5)-methyltransferase
VEEEIVTEKQKKPERTANMRKAANTAGGTGNIKPIVSGNENTREIVLDMLLAILEGNSYSHTVLNSTLKKYQYFDKQERAFMTRLCNGCVKRYLTLDYQINQVATLPVNKMKPLIRNLLRLSVYQIMYMNNIPDAAVCNEAVKLAKKRGFSKLSGFVNGVLRTLIRNRITFEIPVKEQDKADYLKVRTSTPHWLVEKLLGQYNFDLTERMLTASLKEKTTTIRCNKKKISPLKLKEVLIKEGVTVEDSEYLDYAFIIKGYDYLGKMQAFLQGYFMVQDVSSMLVCQAADIKENDFVLDICAAPGGKTLHAAETAKCVMARDLTEYKIKLIEENVLRLGATNVITKMWDATKPDPAMCGKADVVIADLPCSGLGVLGKKADIKYKLTQEQLDELVKLQRNILGVVSEYVKDGGIMIFSTCTVNKEENINNRDWFLKNYEFEAESMDNYLPVQLQNEDTKNGYLQLLQGVHNTDGFFLARMRKK